MAKFLVISEYQDPPIQTLIDNQLIFSSSAVFWKLIHSFNDLSSGTFASRRRVKGPDESSLKLWINFQNTALEENIS